MWWGSRDPLATLVPAYALLVPVAGVVRLPVPLPSPFDTLSSIVGGMAIVAITWHLVRGRRMLRPSGATILWITFLGWATLSVWWSITPSDSLQTAQVAGSLVVLLVLVSITPTEASHLHRLRVALV